MKYYNLNAKFYDGYAYQIPITAPIHWSILNWVQEKSEDRRWRSGLHVSDYHKHYVELKSEEDLAYFLLKWS